MAFTFPIHDPRAEAVPADERGDAVLGELRAPVRDGRSSGVVMTGIAAVLTFGLWPALIWPLRFRHVIDADRLRLGGVAEWLRARVSHPDAPRLRPAADAVRFRPVLYLVGFLGCALWVVAFLWFSGSHAPTWPLLMKSTYLFHPIQLSSGDWISQFVRERAHAPNSGIKKALFAGWAVALSAAFIGQWLQVQLHARSVRRFLDAFNKIALHDALSPVFLAPVGSGLRPFWVIGAVMMAAINAPWGIPLMLASSAQRRYSNRVGPEMRGALAARLREMMAQRRPFAAGAVSPAPTGANSRTRCGTQGCRLPLPAGARFCPRCGKRSAPRVDRVA